MNRYAQVQSATGFVTGVYSIEDIAAFTPPAGYEMVPDPEGAASPGYSWDGIAFTPPPVGEVTVA